MDREKVVAWLADEELYYRDHGNMHNSLMACDTIALIKEQEEQIDTQRKNLIILLNEQEAVEPIPPNDELDLWRCGNCNHQLFRCTHQRYCEMCGKSVKWNES